MIRGVFFDAGHTLFQERRDRWQIYAEVARRHGVEIDVTDCASAMREAHDTLPLRIDGAFRYSPGWFDRFIDHVFTSLGVAGMPAALREELFAVFAQPGTYRLYDDVTETLATLAGSGLRLGVISNWAPHLEDLLTGLGIRDRFEAVVVSAIEEIEKPGPGIFHRAVHRLGMRPQESFHIGDRADLDLAGARHAGLHAGLLCRGATVTDNFEIRDLRDLQSVLANIP